MTTTTYTQSPQTILFSFLHNVFMAARTTCARKLSVAVIFVLYVSLTIPVAKAQDADSDFGDLVFSGLNTQELFASDELLQLTITADFVAITNDTDEESNFHKGSLRYNDGRQSKKIDIKLRTRGHFRKSPCNCSFPPLKIKFDKDDSRQTDFAGQGEVKLVTHCNTKRDVYEQYIIQEYLAYKMYNLITDRSFRVRLAQITYIDKNDAMDSFAKYAFFIESSEALSARLGGSSVNITNVHDERTDAETMTRLAIFQYMIGNTDWSVVKLHNIKLVTTDFSRPPYAVPFDFDWSGIVNAHYAEPATHLNLTSVRDRLYRGYTRSEEQIDNALQVFVAQKNNIYALYENNTQLTEKQKKQSIAYLDAFYRTIAKEKIVANIFIHNARTLDMSAL